MDSPVCSTKNRQDCWSPPDLRGRQNEGRDGWSPPDPSNGCIDARCERVITRPSRKQPSPPSEMIDGGGRGSCWMGIHSMTVGQDPCLLGPYQGQTGVEKVGGIQTHPSGHDGHCIPASAGWYYVGRGRGGMWTGYKIPHQRRCPLRSQLKNRSCSPRSSPLRTANVRSRSGSVSGGGAQAYGVVPLFFYGSSVR